MYTCARFICSFFFKLLLIIELATPNSALRSSTLFPLSLLEIVYFLMSKLISFFTLCARLMSKIV